MLECSDRILFAAVWTGLVHMGNSTSSQWICTGSERPYHASVCCVPHRVSWTRLAMLNL